MQTPQQGRLHLEIPTPAAGAGASQLRECSIERRLVTKSGLEGNLYQRFIGVEKELFSVIDSLIDNPAVNRKSKGFLEGPREMAHRQAALFGDYRQLDIVVRSL